MDNSQRRRRGDGPPTPSRPGPRDDWERAERIADDWEGQREDWEWNAKLANRFHGTTPRQVIEMWKNGTNEKGKPLTKFEVLALVERWCKLFGTLPPSEPAEPKPLTEPIPEDDTMLTIKEVERITGRDMSSINRDYRRKPPTFPPPTHRVGVGNHGKRWKAGVVKVWLAEREWKR